MAFLSKLFSNKASKIKSKSNDSIEAIITDVENRPYGISENNVLFAGLNELGGYFFFQTVIVGQLHVKSKKGAQLTFIGENYKLQFDSDMLEFESEHSDIKGRSVTKIDFQVEESDMTQLENAKLSGVEITVKGQDILFSKYLVSESNDEEE